MTLPRNLTGERGLLRLYTLAGDRWHGRPLTDAVLDAAHRAGLSGATVLRGRMGFGKHGLDTRLSILKVHPERQPVVLELVDSVQHLQTFLQTLQAQHFPDRLITLERAEVLLYQAGE